MPLPRAVADSSLARARQGASASGVSVAPAPLRGPGTAALSGSAAPPDLSCW